MGTDQGGHAREAEGGRGPVGVGREAGGPIFPSGCEGKLGVALLLLVFLFDPFLSGSSYPLR